MKDFSDLSKITTYQSGVIQSAAFRNLKKHTDEALSIHSLSTMQWFIIGTILDADGDGIRITDLARQVGTTLGFLTNAINLLQSRGILMRASHEDDSRAKLVYVSPGYRKTCQKIEEDLRNKLRTTLYAKVTPEELRTYVKVLYQFAELDV